MLGRKNRRAETGGVNPLPRSLLIKKDFKVHWFAYMLILPVIVWYLVFAYAPMWGILVAFMNYRPFLGFWGSEWVGFQHFENFINSIFFWRLIRNTFMLNIWGLVFGFPAPIILALLLNEVRIKWFKKSVQTITYMPYFISLVVAMGMVNIFTAPNGWITQLLSPFFDTQGRSLLSFPSMFRPIFTFSGIWQGVGWGSIIYLASMASISPELYEAASCDGANKLRKMWHITLPGIRPTIIILFIFAMGGLMASGHEKVMLLINPVTYETGDVIAYYVFRRGLRDANYSYGTAVGLMSAAINFVLLWFTNTVVRRYSETSLKT